jgi:hypothetical protein
MTTQTTTAARSRTTFELERYVTDQGERRVLAAHLVGAETATVYDLALNGRGRRYIVEPAVSSIDEVDALRRDYLEQAAALGDCPMSRRAIVRMLKRERVTR